MAWTENPGIPSVLSASRTIDSTIRTDEELANPGTLLPTEGVVFNGQILNIGATSYKIVVTKHIVSLEAA